MGEKMTTGDFLTILAIVCIVVVSTYLVVLIKNLNDGIKVLRKVLQDNKENIDATLKEVPVISKNLAEITSTAKNELKIIENALDNISETVEMTVEAASTFRHGFFGKLRGLVSFVNMAYKVLFKEEKK